MEVLFPPEWKSRVAFLGATSYHCFIISQEGDLFLWGGEKDEKVGMGPVDFCKLIPTLLTNWVAGDRLNQIPTDLK
jgi:hypothetical protein